MATALVAGTGAEDVVTMSDVSWDTYCRLDDENQNPAVRLAYFEGSLELMTVSLVHEYWGDTVAALVRSYARALRLDVAGFGHATMRRKSRHAGVEPDGCFFFGELAAAMKKHQEWDLEAGPGPDLIVEIDISRRSFSKLPLYAALGVREVWQFHQDEAAMYGLFDLRYQQISTSTVLAGLTASKLTRLLAESINRPEHEWDDLIRAAATER